MPIVHSVEVTESCKQFSKIRTGTKPCLQRHVYLPRCDKDRNELGFSCCSTLDRSRTFCFRSDSPGNLAAREPGHRDAGFDYTPELIKGKDFHKMKQVAEAKSTAETVESDGRGNHSMPKEKERNDYLRLKIVTYVIMLHVTVSYPSSMQAFRCLTAIFFFDLAQPSHP